MSQPENTLNEPVGNVAGSSVLRIEGRQMVTGQALFTDDLKRPAMLLSRHASTDR